MVRDGHVTSVEEIFSEGLKIREPEIVDVLLPELQEEVVNINLVQKQTDAGEKSRFKAIVVVGNRDGFVGLGAGKAKQVRAAIEKASVDARLNIILVRRGCGSWECGCGRSHSLPFEIRGKCGSVEILLVPGPRGLGLVASEVAKIVLNLAGVKDCWTKSFGSTRTIPSFAYAVFDGLRKTYSLVTRAEWIR
jgi:small subunit ribosomal protein S5